MEIQELKINKKYFKVGDKVKIDDNLANSDGWSKYPYFAGLYGTIKAIYDNTNIRIVLDKLNPIYSYLDNGNELVIEYNYIYPYDDGVINFWITERERYEN